MTIFLKYSSAIGSGTSVRLDDQIVNAAGLVRLGDGLVADNFGGVVRPWRSAGR